MPGAPGRQDVVNRKLPKTTGERFAFANLRGLVPVSAATSEFLAPSRPIVEAPRGPASRYGVYADRLIPLGAVIGALAVQLMRPTNMDASWLLTVNERILAGATPYKDVIELNPPASILLYRIPVVVANLLSVRSEFVLAATLALLIGGVLAYVARILSRYALNGSAENRVFLLVSALVLAVLPFDEMAQREHFATIFILPYAVVAIARAAGKTIALADSLVVGAMLGLCLAIKPHFVLCALLASSFDALRSRDVRAFFRIENWTAAAVALAYFIGAVFLYPRFFSDVLPMVADLYLPLRIGLVELTKRAAIPVILPVSICWIFRDRRRNAGTIALLLIGAGFFGAYLIQGKGWSYHAYPVIAFCLLAAGWATQGWWSEADGMPRKLGALLMATALVLPAPRFFRPDVSHPGLAEAIAHLAPHPKILAIAFLQNLGHPLTRDVGGVWVGRTWGLWATGGAVLMKARAGADPVLRARADAYFENDRLMLTQDIETQHPDIVLLQETVGFDFGQWIAQSPRLQAAMASYQRVETIDGVEIFRPRDHALE
jgi:hypothetical protein